MGGFHGPPGPFHRDPLHFHGSGAVPPLAIMRKGSLEYLSRLRTFDSGIRFWFCYGRGIWTWELATVDAAVTSHWRHGRDG